MITVYSKGNCPECVRAKQWLSSNNFDYREIAVDRDQSARAFLLARGHRSVPQMYWDQTDIEFVTGGAVGLEKMGVGGVSERIQELAEVFEQVSE